MTSSEPTYEAVIIRKIRSYEIGKNFAVRSQSDIERVVHKGERMNRLRILVLAPSVIQRPLSMPYVHIATRRRLPNSMTLTLVVGAPRGG